jgi:hypothetical protein
MIQVHMREKRRKSIISILAFKTKLFLILFESKKSVRSLDEWILSRIFLENTVETSCVTLSKIYYSRTTRKKNKKKKEKKKKK